MPVLHLFLNTNLFIENGVLGALKIQEFFAFLLHSEIMSGKVKQELRVASYELRVQILELRVKVKDLRVQVH